VIEEKHQQKDNEQYLRTGARAVWGHVKENRFDIVVLVVLSIVISVASALIPYVSGKLFDAINVMAQGGDARWPVLPLTFLSIWFVVEMGMHLLDWGSSLRTQYVRLFFRFNYLAKGVAKLLLFPVTFHKENKAGAVADTISSAGMAISNTLTSVVIDVFPEFISILVGLGIGFWVNASLTWVLCVGMLIYVVILAIVIPRTSAAEKQHQELRIEAQGYLHDVLGSIFAVKQANAEQYEIGQMDERFMGKSVAVWYRMNKLFHTARFLQRAVSTGTQLVIFLIAIRLVANGVITLGELLMFNGYAAMVFGPFARLSAWWRGIQEALVAAAKAEEILHLPTEVYSPKGAARQELFGKVSFDKVHFRYKQQGPEVLQGVTMKVSPGEVVALVGESGVGKSTLVDLISGYYFATSGQVLVDDVPVEKMDLNSLRRQIAVVPQEVSLFNASVADNIRYGTFAATQEEVTRVAKEAQADEFIAHLPRQYEQLVGNRGIKLSVGQKQRIAIARAMLRNPKILILDEPTSALDPQTEVGITAALERLMRGRTTFIIAHRLSTVRKADRIYVLDKGKIAEEGSHTELMQLQGGIYRNLYELHVGLHE